MKRISAAGARSQVRQVLALALCALGGAGMASGLAGCEAEGPIRPDLVLITVDRLAADRLGCLGGALDAGESICALGQRGTLFAWALSPGRGEASGAASVLTGLPEAVHAVGSDGPSFLADAQPSIAEDLSQAGYATAAFVASARVNRSRRLDQGFDRYDDRLASPSRLEALKDTTQDVSLSGLVLDWIAAAPSPWFVWIHADRQAGLAELDRLVSRLSHTLDREPERPGILFVALRGEPAAANPENDGPAETIGWRTHRIPLIWRPAATAAPAPAAVSWRLASLFDVAPTLRAAARLRPATRISQNASGQGPAVGSGLDLNRPSSRPIEEEPDLDRFLLLETELSGGDVGLASGRHLYTRHASRLDGSGRPVATSSLISLAARFSTLPEDDRPDEAPLRSARFEPPPWRSDVLAAESPVSRLEFHLARQLRAQRDAGPTGQGRNFE